MVTRIFALFVALLTLANLIGDLLWPGFDGNNWWISFGPLPAWISNSLLAVSALALTAFAFRRPMRQQRSRWIAGAALLLALVALANTAGFYLVLLRGDIAAAFPLPLSLLVCAGMLLVARAAWSLDATPRPVRAWKVAAGGLCLFTGFPLALMLFFGNTDYRRPSEVAVVFGARVLENGKMSNALQDRIRTACELYRAGLVKRLILSGGPGDGAVTEAEAMRQYALNHGVRAEDIVLDNQGLNTEATVRNSMPVIREWHAHRVLVVSHFYHLPRIKLAYQRAGIEVCTVPAPQGHFLGKLPFYMAREVIAFWKYYLNEKPTPISAQA